MRTEWTIRANEIPSGAKAPSFFGDFRRDSSRTLTQSLTRGELLVG